jgi:ribonucleoside-diphosphate reductase alpha chain
VAPTKSSSFILGQVSPSIEPLKSNYYVRDRAKIKTTYRNPHLEAVLEDHGRNDEETWKSIGMNDGSVQHLDFLTDHERDVFKTFVEISQGSIINQAAQRQRWIDQGQSLNIAIDPEQFSTRDINKLYIDAWNKGVKTLYYQNNLNAAQQLSRDILSCQACEA